MSNEDMTFWEHLDVFRTTLIRILLVSMGCGVVAFVLKEPLFDLILAPCESNFVTYRIIQSPPFSIKLVNIHLAEQFVLHVKTACCFGIVLASPYVLYMLYRFIAPALYPREKRYAGRIVTAAYIMFMLGVLANYFVVFPLTVRFLGTYSVSEQVGNMLTLQSYIDTLIMMSIMFGALFEIPVISWLLAIFGLLHSEWMLHYWRHAIVAIVTVAAIITPTGDAFTLLLVSLPIWLLYLISIFIVKRTEKKGIQEPTEPIIS